MEINTIPYIYVSSIKYDYNNYLVPMMTFLSYGFDIYKSDRNCILVVL